MHTQVVSGVERTETLKSVTHTHTHTHTNMLHMEMSTLSKTTYLLAGIHQTLEQVDAVRQVCVSSVSVCVSSVSVCVWLSVHSSTVGDELCV